MREGHCNDGVFLTQLLQGAPPSSLCRIAEGKLFKVLFLEYYGEPMDTEEFAEYLEGKTLKEIVHRAKKESEKRMLAQGIAPIALFVSEVLFRFLCSSRNSCNSIPKCSNL